MPFECKNVATFRVYWR